MKYLMTKRELNLRQRRWLELLKDYDLVIDYHPGKTNVVVDALSQKSLFTLRAMNAHLAFESDGSVVAKLKTRPLFFQRIQDLKIEDLKLTKLAHFIPIRTDFLLEKLVELYVTEIVRLHGVPLSIISYRDTRFTLRFWGKLYEALGSWERYLPLVEFAYNNSYQSSIKMAPLEALYRRKCRTPLYWSELSESKLVGTDLIKETEDGVRIIRDCLKATFDHQNLYATLKMKDIEFTIGNRVFLKVSPWKKVLRFGRKGKLSLRFIGPYELIERVGLVAYRVALPLEVNKIHNVFHVLILRQYRLDPSHVLTPCEVEIRLDLSYSEELIRILAREEKELRNKKGIISEDLIESSWS
ncbi:Retrotransposon protein, Ty3-gypsy subclass [Gossypium australe]|uniref:Retrotransposon protein, Ty3-gypsy subclass n=1 Tax=Gossypium australe TaxID=47621 RepID=A0A5B6WRD8_9ROSI|nr:Retrotransposon protein, Ty3-gypsy subclass [Gossypium australe]